jgi:superfamily II DNA or RNA helicase
VPALEPKSKVLRRQTTDEFRLYRAALEWDLQDPIVIETRKDLKSESRWRDRLEPYHHQVTNLITFCRRLPVTLLADDVGLGKTISAGLVASELVARGRVSSILVVCPKLLRPQWCDVLQSKFDIPAQVAVGQDLIDAKGPGAVVTTYASARLHLEKIPEERFEMLVLDEAHKLRNLYGVDPPPQVAVRFRGMLERRRFRYVLMLTATPIHNRLWDLYSLVDLLTVARGHENPFGSEGMFARKFIADTREQARRLKPEAREEFRSIVYGYMSRMRRGDAKLVFPDRVVQLHKVDPTPGELALISTIAEPIQKLNRLAQISILQALTSSPHALAAQLNTMARNRTVPLDLAESVQAIVTKMGITAKLRGLETLVSQLKRENPERWRMVVFTGRLETQTTIQAFLEQMGLKVGIINGSSGQRNQSTIAGFRQNPPAAHVIVSTEAGSEGVNLQVANVLVNYDLPWNPMIVEQRIGRIQRLASDHARVSILNIILRGTFEEFIVGRLMEKLQMAAHAIGDIEAMLEASGLDDDEGGDEGFDEKIRRLVVAALAGKDFEAATRQMEMNIAEAKTKLQDEQANIDAMLGSMTGAEYVGPRSPKLPTAVRSMEGREFAQAALASLGVRVTPETAGVFRAEIDGSREWIRFETETGATGPRTTLYTPGSPAFSRLVDRIVASGAHQVDDLDRNPSAAGKMAAHLWAEGFGGMPVAEEIKEVRRCFEGTALVRVRATVAHDSYERLVDVTCPATEHVRKVGPEGLRALGDVIENANTLGLDAERIEEACRLDQGIAEFCRFYLERREQEVEAAGGDQRKRKKLEDEFTPRLETTVVAMQGKMHRELSVVSHYKLGGENAYASTVAVLPHTGTVVRAPEMVCCERTRQTVPKDCLGRCEITGMQVLLHLLAKSEISARLALREHTLKCGLSDKLILSDEAEVSSVSAQSVARALLRTSQVSGRRAEPNYFGRCEISGADVLLSELAVSQASGKRYRVDQQERSVVSGKTGHRTEFIQCYETRQPLLPAEAQKCQATGRLVRPGVLEQCAVTQKTVLPSELDRCAATTVRALRGLMVTSSVSGARVLENTAVRSVTGKFCLPAEAKQCLWSGQACHPDDLRRCALTGVSVHSRFVASDSHPQLQPLAELLQGVLRTGDQVDLWSAIADKTSKALRGVRCQVESASLSPDQQHLAVCLEVRTLLGLRVRQAGLLFSILGKSIVGRIGVGKRTPKSWEEAAAH